MPTTLIERPVLAALSGARFDGPTMFMEGKLDRKLYTRVNAIIEAAGGKWNRKAKGHVFPTDAADVMDPILLTGIIERRPNEKQLLGAFYSPPAVVAKIMSRAESLSGARVLEPSAGGGAIARAAREAGADVHCVEINETAASGLREQGFMVECCDFLTVSPTPTFDAVLMNPPFAKQADIAHVRHAARFVRACGTLVSVMAAGVAFREDRKSAEFREWVAERGTIEPLPERSFRESGTDISTVLVTVSP